jgi:hypothetical protein
MDNQPVRPHQNPPEVEKETQPNHPSIKSKLFLVLLIVLLFLFVFGGIIIGSYFKVLQNNSPIPTSIPMPTITPMDITTYWKTYTNPQYGYTIKYPNTWYLNEKQDKTSESKYTVRFTPTSTKGENQGVWITIRNDKFTFTNIDDWWKQYKESLLTPKNSEDIKEKQFLKDNFNDLFNVRNIYVNGKRAIAFESTIKYQSKYFKNIFLLNSNNDVVSINTSIQVNSTDQNSKVFDQILSTFKLTDKSLMEDTKNWKTYSDNIDFTFKYPADWYTKTTADKKSIFFDVNKIEDNRTIDPLKVPITFDYWILPPDMVDYIPFGNTPTDTERKYYNGYTLKYETNLRNDGKIGPLTQAIKAYVINKGNIYVFGLSNLEYKSIFDQIIASFELTNLSETPNIFSFESAKPGFVVANMSIRNIRSYRNPEKKPELSDLSISFNGVATLSGVVRMNELGGNVCFYSDYISSLKLPTLKEVDKNGQNYFCFENQPEASKSLKEKDQVTIIIDNFTINNYPASIWNSAKFISLVN